ncbi:RND superfamily putative drug exporter [Haloactinopolyspora alba]|uniref:RND superfamily putative drug exporter n=1 Tax=Haloactinopolyspora alba TaxID=648780 RepID=A0A2P8E9K5_9ACTN|nr:MMPL family transporter [Haloactinopolyspora alba]PSL06166.1 RND superfamily putative drug exporter [Haloactinopolyspora alba]
MFARWGTAVTHRRVPVLVAVIVVALALGGYGLGVFGSLSQGGYDDPGSEAAQAVRLSQQNPAAASPDVVAVYTAPEGTTVDSPGVRRPVTAALGDLPADSVAAVRSYWNSDDPSLRGDGGRSGLALITLAGDSSDEKHDAFDRIEESLHVEGVRTELAGQIPLEAGTSEQIEQDLVLAEAVSLPVVLVLLVLIFGGVVAAALPVLVGALSVLSALGVLHVIAGMTTVSEFAVNVASLLGLGMAIDYGLFVVSRFREELDDGVDAHEAVRRTVATAGRTVAFSATLLIIALSTLLLFPQNFLNSLAYGGMAAVALAALISLTVLPAVLSLLGRRVDALAIRRRGGPARPGRFWPRLADGVMRRPLLVALPILAVLMLLISPFLDARFGQPDERILPEDDPARAAVEYLEAQFPDVSADTVRVVLDTRGTAASPSELESFAAEIREVGGVTQVAPAGALDAGVVVLDVWYEGATFGDRARDVVGDIRAMDPPAEAGMLVGGLTATSVDSLDAITDRLPVMIAVLVGATLVLLFLAFGSVVLPLKAAIMAAVSLTATFGVLTWIFVDGHGAGLLHVTPQPMEVGTVVLMAAVVFGLSTDYEVFLLSRVVEAHDDGATTAEAVRTGLTRSGRVITAAALLLIVVVGAFSLSGIQMMRFIGVGMIIALALDATVIRMLLVPALLKLLGPANWWAPGPLRRLRPHSDPP